MDENQFELVVHTGRRSIFSLFLSSIFFTATLYVLYYDAVILYLSDDWTSVMIVIINSIKIVTITTVAGIRFCVMKDVLIDVDTNLLISRYRIGPFSKDFKKDCPTLEYVAVFKKRENDYQVNLWYKGNKHYMMYDFEEAAPAFDFATMIAKKLNLDLLDATVANNSRWLDF